MLEPATLTAIITSVSAIVLAGIGLLTKKNSSCDFAKCCRLNCFSTNMDRPETAQNVEKSVEILSGNKTNIEKSVDILSGNKQNIEKSVDILSGNKQNIEKSVDILSGNKVNIEKSVDILSGNKQNIEKSVDILSGNKVNIEKSVDILSGNKQNIEKSVDILTINKENIDFIKNEMINLKMEMMERMSQQDAKSEQVNLLEEHIE